MFCCCAPTPEEKQAFAHVQSIPVTDERAQAVEPETVVVEEVPAQEPEAVPEPKAEPAEEKEPTTFTINLNKAGADGAVGWHLDLLDNKALFVCRIIAVGGTPVQNYNATAPKGKDIREGDYIKQVNGDSSSADAMSTKMKNADQLQIVIQRPYLFSKTLLKNGESMGLDLKYGPGGSSLLIEMVREGAMKRCCPEVQAGDRIVTVNGDSGTPYWLMQAAKDLESPLLGFSRCL